MSSTLKKMIAIQIAVIFFVVLDRFLKILALTNPGRQYNLIGEALRYRFQTNYYIAFSLPLSGWWLTVLILLIIIILIIIFLLCYQKQEYTKLAPLSLIILGASSNLFDRVRYGSVIDYLDLSYFTVFNLADAMIVIGVLLLIFFSYKKRLDQPDIR